jgi:hypothetical protein
VYFIFVAFCFTYIEMCVMRDMVLLTYGVLPFFGRHVVMHFPSSWIDEDGTTKNCLPGFSM